jgi:hypothetical protein
MTTDLRDALHEAAASPSRDVNVGALVASAKRTKRNRYLVAGSLVACLAIALSAFAVATHSAKSSNVAIGASGSNDDTPEGWQRIELPDQGLFIAIPPEWNQVTAVDTLSPPLLVVGVGESSFDPRLACLTSRDGQPLVKGTWLSLYESPADGVPGAPSRPADFTDPANSGMVDTGCNEGMEAVAAVELVSYKFLDHGRLLQATIVTTELPDRTNEQLARRILNTLRVEPLGDGDASSTTTASGPSSGPSSGPVPTITTLPAPEYVPTTADETAIRDLFLAWIASYPAYDVSPWVEDGASIQDAWNQGLAQNPPNIQAHWKIRVDNVSIVDDTHADVQYSLLWDGFPRYDHMPGAAIKVDGTWKVTRNTVCNILKYGGITCPPRS